jgi:hypothetical protein
VEDEVHAVAQPDRLLHRLADRLHGRVFIADDGEVLGLGEQRLAVLALAEVRLRVSDLHLKLCQLRRVRLCHRFDEVLVLRPAEIFAAEFVQRRHRFGLDCRQELLLRFGVLRVDVQ